MPTKQKAPISFRIKRSPRTKQFRCVVQAGNNEVIFTGEPCKNRLDVVHMMNNFIEAIREFNFSTTDETEPVKKPRLNNSKLNRPWP